MNAPKKPDTPLRKQKPMRRVVLALTPCVAGSVYYFGWRCLAVVAVACLAGFLTEYAFCRKRGEPVSEAVFVTAILYALILPPTIPWHVVVIGIVFSVAFGKEVFGGFGRNVFNPAMSGRCFVYICFPVAMTSQWVSPAQGTLGALAQWTTAVTPDAITSATPMTLMKAGGEVPPLGDLFFGRISGCMGETSALLILIGGLYLFYTKTANRTIIVTLLLVYAGLNQALTWIGVPGIHGAPAVVLGTGFLLGTFFMATDPVSGPMTQPGRIVFATMIAVFTLVIRNYSIFNEGFMFSLLLGNMFAPIVDYWAKQNQQKKKAALAAQKV